MLILSRKKNESIVINDDITVVVLEIRGDKVRLAVEAPKEIRRDKGQDAAESNEESIRRQIQELQRQIRELEAQLTV